MVASDGRLRTGHVLLAALRRALERRHWRGLAHACGPFAAARLLRARKLPRAFSILQMGTLIGSGFAYAGSGLVIGIVSARAPIMLPFTGTLAPWQLAFLAAAAPGPLIALLMLTVREPWRRKNPLLRTSGSQEPDFGRFMTKRALFFVGYLGAASFLSIVAYGIGSWTPSFFIRSFGWSAAKIGVVYGCIIIGDRHLRNTARRLHRRNVDTSK